MGIFGRWLRRSKSNGSAFCRTRTRYRTIETRARLPVRCNATPIHPSTHTEFPLPSAKHPLYMSADATIPPSKRPYGHPLLGRFRVGRRMAVLVGAVAVLGMTYQQTRPPELVWWRSPPLGSAKHRVRMLLPNGWKLDSRNSRITDSCPYFFISPLQDTRPKFLRWLIPSKEETAMAFLSVRETLPGQYAISTTEILIRITPQPLQVRRSVALPDASMSADLTYIRCNSREFNRTKVRICNSLTIE